MSIGLEPGWDDYVSFYGQPASERGTWWPSGAFCVPMDGLRKLLARSARHHARQTVRLFVSDASDERLQAAVSAGTAVELLAKAFLASVEPVLLTEKGDRDSLLLLSDKAHLTDSKPGDVRTLGAHEALLVTRHLHKAFLYNPQADRVVLQVRNAAIHMALVEQTQLRQAVLVMCRLVEGLLAPLALNREAFWGQIAMPAVDGLLDEAQDELAQVVEAKKAAARSRLARLLTGLDSAAIAVVLASLSRSKRVTCEHDQPWTCPVCEQRAYLCCQVEGGGMNWPDDGSYVPRTAYPVSFSCSVCELELDADELIELGVLPVLDLEREDADEDWFRNR